MAVLAVTSSPTSPRPPRVAPKAVSVQELAKQGYKRRGRQAGHLTQASNATLVAPRAGCAACQFSRPRPAAARSTVSKGPPAMQPFGAEAKPRVMCIMPAL